MRVKQTKRPKTLTITLITAAAVILLVGGYFTYAYTTKTIWPFQEAASDTLQDTANNQLHQNTPDAPGSSTPSTPEDTPQKTPVPYEGDNPNTGQELSGVINYHGVSGSSLAIRITIDQIIASGSCTLTLTAKDGKTVTRTVDTAQNPSSTTCRGFDIPISDLGRGEWDIKVDILTDGKSGVITGKTTV